MPRLPPRSSRFASYATPFSGGVPPQRPPSSQASPLSLRATPPSLRPSPTRHCERSEAIQGARPSSGLLRATPSQ
ncbi:MAG: hypothetical protein LBT00_07910 [Spirochaetaceae bacterium]|nr:hypothetical protein [Spirochaetaceae bacterium]